MGRMRKYIYIILILVIIVAGLLRFYGMDWGIPKEPYWRNHYQDEAFVLGLLFKMEPPSLSPHYFINPTFHYYTILFSLKVASLFRYLKSFSLPIKTDRFGQPTEKISLSDYAKMFKVGRLISIVEGIILILLIFLITRNLYNEKVGIIAALFSAIIPSLIYQSHFLVVDAPGVFWLILAFWFITTKVPAKKMTLWFILAGLFIGLAVGTKYTNLLLFLPFLFKVYNLNKKKKIPLLKKLFCNYTFITILVAGLIFLLTTPYSILSLNEFLNGDENGFGGIFGRRGLLYYNAYPTNLILPFSLATYHSLRLPLTIFAFLSLIYLIYKRRNSDLMLLFFIIPFYLMLVYRASPHLRHILPVLPFLIIGLSRTIEDLILNQKIKVIKPFLIGAIIFTFVYTLLFSLAMLKRMTPVDTRIESADWVKENIPKDATIGLASFFPWNYTPPIEMITDKIVMTGYNYENLLRLAPDYFIITEYEVKEFSGARDNIWTCEQFIKQLAQQNKYKLVKKFYNEFEILGVKFYPDFPNMEWNPVNPQIYIYENSLRK